VGLKQLFQLLHGSHRPQPGAETKPQARGAASVAQKLDGAAQGGGGIALASLRAGPAPGRPHRRPSTIWFAASSPSSIITSNYRCR
jgi:hypothetical protein